MVPPKGLGVWFCGIAVLACAESPAYAQTPTVLARAGHCLIKVSATITSPTRLIVQRDESIIFDDIVRAGDLPRTFKVGRAIGTTTEIKVGLGATATKVALAAADGTADGCTASSPDDGDDDDVFTANGYYGMSVDTFAAEDLQHYLNPNESGDKRYSDNAGVNFEYRVFRKGHVSLWITGETLHSVKSTDVNCAENPDLTQCQGFTANPGQKFLAIVRAAQSVEANASLRLHLWEVNRGSSSPAALYVQAKIGYITVAKSDADAAEMRTYSLGFIATGGRFAGSYLDVGGGPSDVYRDPYKKRLKVDGLLSIELSMSSSIRPYIQMTVDADKGPGPDSIQTFIGVDFDLRSIFGK